MWKESLLLTLLSVSCYATEKPISPLEDIQLIHPHVISIERFQSLLRRAGEIFRPVSEKDDDVGEISEKNDNLFNSYGYLQPPIDSPFDYYQPLFQRSEFDKSDIKSRYLEDITPPPIPNNIMGKNINYYAEKPRKLSKKYNNAIKQINLKWLNTLETQNRLPKAVYLVNDERNRINFDDSFFADININTPNNELQKENQNRQAEMFRNKYMTDRPEMDDLMAVAAQHLPQIQPNEVLIVKK